FGVFMALGLPHRRVEEWKYTDLRARLKAVGTIDPDHRASLAASKLDTALGPLADVQAVRVVLVDGVYSAELSTRELPDAIKITPLSEALAADASVLTGENALQREADESVVALNTAFATDGAVIEIATGATVAKPIMLVQVRSGDEARVSATRNVVKVGAGAKVTVVEAIVSVGDASATADDGAVLNTATRISVGDGAHVTHVSSNTDRGAVHLGTWSADIGAETVYRPFYFSASPALARNQLFLTFAGEGAALDASGCFLARGREHIDNTLLIDHAVPACESRELFKGVLDDTARGIFQGKVVVRKIAQKTDGKQMAQALMLSPTCEFDSKPELEIYADDVVCGHGSTCAEIDPDLVFYFRSRGIPEATARALLMESFVGEAIEQIEDEPVADAISELARGWLNDLRADAA
ncbi:MAG: Fe-S cluster assembly protein SufD, partial [Pseudomonadota bacterium]